MRWDFPPADPASVQKLAGELHLPPLVARLLVTRNITEPETAHRFLHPDLRHLHNPFLMADMQVAVERLRRAIAQQEKILIYGDYDVDGMMAVVVVESALRGLGANVEIHIPHRLTDGYGMRVPVIERAAAEGCRVVLSVDTGVREHEVIARARELGVDCIVTDHHLPEGRLPPAVAILNPRRSDCPYPDKNLSGVGVAFKLAQALWGPELSPQRIHSYLKLVCLGTIADVVPLVGENRVIAHFGLAALRQPSHPGLTALLAISGLNGQAVTAGDVGFRLAPRLNAAGRMENGRAVLRLFTTAAASEARTLAERLDNLNRERQRLEESILEQIGERMARQPTTRERYTLVLAGQGWHRGVIGIVAQRIADRYHRPALVIGVEGDVGVGSGRSIPGFHLLEALARQGDLFERFGGHAQAAGFTLRAAAIPQLEGRLEEYARTVLSPSQLEPVLRVDGEASLADLDWTLYENLQKLAPFGFGNPTPVFAARNVTVTAPPRILKEKHLKLRVSRNAAAFDALGWGRARDAARLAAGKRLDLAFTLEQNIFQNVTTLQLVLKDLRVREG
jgi:single-stranded-DNA-specific exonuclease